MKIKKSSWITIGIIFAVIIFAVIMKNTIGNGTPQNIIECIGQNSELYTQYGCHACNNQLKLFGLDVTGLNKNELKNYFENSQLNIIDCFYEREKCADIQYTPTWIINEEKYVGVQSVEELKKLTGC